MEVQSSKFLILSTDSVFVSLGTRDSDFHVILDSEVLPMVYRSSTLDILARMEEYGYRLVLLEGQNKLPRNLEDVRIATNSIRISITERAQTTISAILEEQSDDLIFHTILPSSQVVEKVVRELGNVDPYSIVVDFDGTPDISGINPGLRVSSAIAQELGCLWMSLDEMFPLKELKLEDEFPANESQILLVMGTPISDLNDHQRLAAKLEGFELIHYLEKQRIRNLKTRDNIRAAIHFSGTGIIDYQMVGLVFRFLSSHIDRTSFNIVWFCSNNIYRNRNSIKAVQLIDIDQQFELLIVRYMDKVLKYDVGFDEFESN